MRKQIFKAIADAVAAVPGVAFVDLWNNQVQTLNGGAAFAFPAVFIEFEAVEWKQQNMGARRGALAVRLHVVTRAVPTHGHKDPRINEALAVFDLLDAINAAMQDLRGENFWPMGQNGCFSERKTPICRSIGQFGCYNRRNSL